MARSLHRSAAVSASLCIILALAGCHSPAPSSSGHTPSAEAAPGTTPASSNAQGSQAAAGDQAAASDHQRDQDVATPVKLPENVLPETAPPAPKATAKNESASAPATCGEPTAQGALARWASQVDFRGFSPSTDYAETSGYDPCAALSWIDVPIEGGTGSSPHHIMLFHRGEYLGTATKKSYGYTPTIHRNSDAAISVVYHWPRPGETNAESSGESHAQFRWDDNEGHVVMTGEVPPPGAG